MTEAIYYILLSLRQPNHGYGIIQEVNEMTGGRVNLGPRTLYGAISSLLEKGWITALPGEKDSSFPDKRENRKKEYQITSEGRLALMDEIARLTELLENGKKLFGGKSDA